MTFNTKIMVYKYLYLAIFVVFILHNTSFSCFVNGYPLDENQKTNSEGFWKSFVSSLSMIFLSELGDKTFLISAIMATKHKKWIVFSASILALAIMTIISAVLGAFLFNLIPVLYTKVASAILFFIFGIVMLHDGWKMKRTTNTVDQVQEVCSEIDSLNAIIVEESSAELSQSINRISNITTNDDNVDKHKDSASSSSISDSISSPSLLLSHDISPHSISPSNETCASKFKINLLFKKFSILFKKLVSIVFFQTAGLCFLAEWGDRSQIATIALVASGVSILFIYCNTIID